MSRREMMRRRMMTDGRNPYGSKGGYIVSRSPRRDRRMSRDYRMEDYNRYGDSEYSRMDSARGRMDYERNGQYDMASRYPFRVSGEFGRYDSNMGEYDGHHYDPYYDDMRYDMARRGGRRDYGEPDYLEDDDIEDWADKLKREVEEKDKQFLSKENIKRKATEMGIKFDKFSFEEFYVAVLMTYTDYRKTLGTANMDIYLKLAKDWLCDEDVAVKYGEKLATYYDYIVEGM